MSIPRIVTWDDERTWSTIVRLEHGENYVQQAVTAEAAEDVADYPQLIVDVLKNLCREWNKRFGGRPLAVTATGELYEDVPIDDNVIEGEIVEGGETNATRGCIEGR